MRLIYAPAAICFLVCLGVCAHAQTKIPLEFQSGGPRMGWVADKVTAPPDNAQKWDGPFENFDASSASADAYLQVLDIPTQNMAVKKVGDAKKGWHILDSDFNRIAHVTVRVEYEAKPLAAAHVSLNDGLQTQEQVIDSSAKGAADFYGVKAGQLKLTVEYRSNGESKTQKLSFEEDARRDAVAPTLIVSVPDPADTVGPSPATGHSAGQGANPGPQRTAAPRPVSNLVSEIFLYLFGLLFVALLVYLGFLWLNKNPQKSHEVLNRFGVSLQEPQPPAPGDLVAASPPAPQPQKQILLADSAPTPLTHQAPVVTLTPRLVSHDGQSFDLPDGVFTVGRDAGLSLSLTAENSVSRKHAEVVRSGNRVSVRDLGSTNGTFLNGSKVSGEAELHSGDSVQFGTVRFRFEG